MSKKSNDVVQPPEFSDSEIAMARKCFARARELAEKKSYDYAIEMYINGLFHWPEAVEEGHKPCWASALFRGGTKIGLRDKMKYKTGAKDPKEAMLNAEMLLSKDTKNIGYMEAMFKNAARGRFDQTTMWIGEIFADAVVREPKPSFAYFQLLREVYEKLGESAQETDPALAIAAMDRAVQAQTRMRHFKPNDMEISTDLRDLAGKLTILKGRYSDAESFKDSIEDSEGQRELHDRDRVVQADDRMEELLLSARRRYEANPTDNGAITKYIDLLTRRERKEEERIAVKVLTDAYQATNEYRYKFRADEIRLRYLRRVERALQEKGDSKALEEQRAERLRRQIKIFEERSRHYPSDMRIRYQYGERLFESRQFDEAIPVLQEARNDPKVRFQCALFIGRCFYERGYFDQSADTFREAIEAYETPDDKLGKEIHYWLGRSLESDGNVEDALKIYGQLIQWDYNYRDVRQRIDDLKGKR